MLKSFKNSIANPLLQKLGLEICRIREQSTEFSLSKANSLTFESIRQSIIKNASSESFVIVIGAHDIISFDSIASYLPSTSAQIIMFEPRSASCASLNSNLKSLDLKNYNVVQKAVHQSLSECDMYEIDPKYTNEYPDWAQGIASFSKDHVLKTAIETHIRKQVVLCSNPDMWTSEYGISSISYLQIDTEGYDYEILKSINLYAFKPIAIMLEYVNLSLSDRLECCTYLHSHGYDTLSNGEDVLAVDLSRLIDR